MAPAGAALWRSLHAYQVFGANTSIGKTVISTILYKANRARHPDGNRWFLKPVSTGPETEADDRWVSTVSSDFLFYFGCLCLEGFCLKYGLT